MSVATVNPWQPAISARNYSLSLLQHLHHSPAPPRAAPPHHPPPLPHAAPSPAPRTNRLSNATTPARQHAPVTVALRVKVKSCLKVEKVND
ncbi:hypothetical protein E2C01_087769 [Portunus trituberculatus]|uniref:Uncharacterized protein n=1 Tax=Portunus trituberculatus TaxID=210409 RepID=A0A5B7JEZ0_PORTR|nr:hypothetical protein [Portunus trituberculatus]